MNDFHETNRKSWDAVSPQWQDGVEANKPWREVPARPELALHSSELEILGDLSGRDVCVLGSGDNVVVFAMAGMGARVTSVDISEVQLETAARRAAELGLSIDFKRADVTDLKELPSTSFDFVYTGGHVAVWVSDLGAFYEEAARILRSGGLLIVSEYHPIRRIWKDGIDRLELGMSYFDKGPFQYDRSEQVPESKPGSYPSFEFHWTVSDYVKSIMNAGCDLVSMQEWGDDPQKWEAAPVKGLPETLFLVGRKR